MVGAYWVQPGVTYEAVFNWIDVTFRPLFYAAEQDVRNVVETKRNEGARSKAKNRDAALTTLIISKVGRVLGPEPLPTFQPIQPLHPGLRSGPVTRSNAARANNALQPPQLQLQPQPQPQPRLLEETVATRLPPSPPTKRTRYEPTGPVLSLPYVWNTSFPLHIADYLYSQEVVDLTMMD